MQAFRATAVTAASTALRVQRTLYSIFEPLRFELRSFIFFPFGKVKGFLLSMSSGLLEVFDSFFLFFDYEIYRERYER